MDKKKIIIKPTQATSKNRVKAQKSSSTNETNDQGCKLYPTKLNDNIIMEPILSFFIRTNMTNQ